MPPAFFYDQNRRVQKRGYDASERTDAEIEALYQQQLELHAVATKTSESEHINKKTRVTESGEESDGETLYSESGEESDGETLYSESGEESLYTESDEESGEESLATESDEESLATESDEDHKARLDLFVKMQDAVKTLKEEISTDEEFVLSESKAMLVVSADQLFQFIWDYVPAEEIHWIAGVFDQKASREEVESFLQDDTTCILCLMENAVSNADAMLDDY